MSRPASESTQGGAPIKIGVEDYKKKLEALQAKLNPGEDPSAAYVMPINNEMRKEAALLGLEIRDGQLFKKWDEQLYSTGRTPIYDVDGKAYELPQGVGSLFNEKGAYAVTRPVAVVATNEGRYAEVDESQVGKGATQQEGPPVNMSTHPTMRGGAGKSRVPLMPDTFVNPNSLEAKSSAASQTLYDTADYVYDTVRNEGISAPPSAIDRPLPPLASAPPTLQRRKQQLPGLDGAAFTDNGEIDLSQTGATQDGLRKAQGITKGVEEKAKIDPKCADKYNAIIAVANNHDLRAKAEDAKSQIDAIVKDSNDPALRMFASAVNAIFNAPAGTSDKDKDAAFSEVIKSFFFLEKPGTDMEKHCENAMRAMKLITNDGETLDQDGKKVGSGIKDVALRGHIDKAVKQDFAAHYGQQTADLQADVNEQEERGKQVTGDAQNKKDRANPSKPVKKPEEESKGLSAKSALIGTVKSGVAIGLAVGAPPIGWALAIGFLVATRNWGNVKAKETDQDREDKEELEYLRAREAARANEKFKPKHKDPLSLGDLEGSASAPAQSAGVSVSAPTQSAPVQSGPAQSVGVSVSVPTQSAPDPSEGTHLGSVLAHVASRDSADLRSQCSVLVDSLAPTKDAPVVAVSDQVYADLTSDRAIYAPVSSAPKESLQTASSVEVVYDYASSSMPSSQPIYDNVPSSSSPKQEEKPEVDLRTGVDGAKERRLAQEVAGDLRRDGVIGEEQEGVDLNANGSVPDQRDHVKDALVK